MKNETDITWLITTSIKKKLYRKYPSVLDYFSCCKFTFKTNFCQKPFWLAYLNDLIQFVKCLPGGSPSIAHDGRVLANNMNGTGTVCGYMWDDTDADVLCRQMGFPSGIAILMPRDPVFNRFVFNVNCLGNETDIQSCPAFDYDVSGMCSMYEDAGVLCSGMTSGKAKCIWKSRNKIYIYEMSVSSTSIAKCASNCWVLFESIMYSIYITCRRL